MFANSIGPDGPFLMMVTQFPSMAGFEQSRDKLNGDADFVKAWMRSMRSPA